jgi:hypothetical protein
MRMRCRRSRRTRRVGVRRFYMADPSDASPYHVGLRHARRPDAPNRFLSWVPSSGLLNSSRLIATDFADLVRRRAFDVIYDDDIHGSLGRF